MTNILEARGIFWWQSTPVPDGHFAPEDSVYGTLTITANGKISLELDGRMPGAGRQNGILAQEESLAAKMSIQGILKSPSHHVLLQGLRHNGSGFANGGISYEQFLASTCLVGPTEISHAEQTPNFTRLSISLRGFEAWTSLRSIDANWQDRGLTINYIEPESLSFDVVGGKISINHDIKAPLSYGVPPMKFNRVTLEEQSDLIYEPSAHCSLEEMMKQFHLIGDLLNLLADTTFQLNWPFLNAAGIEGGRPLRLYFERRTTNAEPPGWTDCWALLPAIKNDFGRIYSNWIEKREQYGPGYYLFLGTRRGMALYIEHHYVNLIWGIESLHRRQPAKIVGPSKTEKRVQKILSQVSGNGDKSWLKGRLKYAGEPNLETRIFETFSRLPFTFSVKELRSFAKSCADRRNDISHFGGQKPGGSYSEFLGELELKNRALAYLVHAYILFDIGVPSETLNFWFFLGPKSYQIKAVLDAAGLGSLAKLLSPTEAQSPKVGVVDQGPLQADAAVAPNSACQSDSK